MSASVRHWREADTKRAPAAAEKAKLRSCRLDISADGPISIVVGAAAKSPGFGNKMRQWCDEAGLPQCTALGLRKAMMRRVADLDLANRTLKPVSGHCRDEEASVYPEGVNQARLAEEGINLVSRWESNRERLTGGENVTTS